MRVLANPVVLRATVVLFAASLGFLIVLIVMRRLRKSIREEADFSVSGSPALAAMPMHVYNTVIQQLKQQKVELQNQSQAEQQRARAIETLNQAVVANLSSGVLVFGSSGLVKTSNPAARQILGFASMTGMGAEDIFRGAMVCAQRTETQDQFEDQSCGLADEVQAVLGGDGARRDLEAEYETPAGESRRVSVTISPVTADGKAIGVACLIEQIGGSTSRGRISRQIGQQLRTSAGNISRHARELAQNPDPEVARQLVASLADEAVRLEAELGELVPGDLPRQSVASPSE